MAGQTSLHLIKITSIGTLQNSGRLGTHEATRNLALAAATEEEDDEQPSKHR